MRLSTALGLLVVALVALPAAAENSSAFITGDKQGFIAGDDVQKATNGGIIVLSVNVGVDVPRDPASGLPTGKRRYSPIHITKLPDKASTKLLTAAVTNENLKTVEIRFYRPTTTGANVLYHTFKLSNAKIVSFTQGGDTRASGGVVEDIAFVFEKIEVQDNVNGTVAMDDWLSLP